MTQDFRTRKDGRKYPLSSVGKSYKKDYDYNGHKHTVDMGKNDVTEIFFEGHTFEIKYDPETNENLKMKKVI